MAEYQSIVDGMRSAIGSGGFARTSSAGGGMSKAMMNAHRQQSSGSTGGFTGVSAVNKNGAEDYRQKMAGSNASSNQLMQQYLARMREYVNGAGKVAGLQNAAQNIQRNGVPVTSNGLQQVQQNYTRQQYPNLEQMPHIVNDVTGNAEAQSRVNAILAKYGIAPQTGTVTPLPQVLPTPDWYTAQRMTPEQLTGATQSYASAPIPQDLLGTSTPTTMSPEQQALIQRERIAKSQQLQAERMAGGEMPTRYLMQNDPIQQRIMDAQAKYSLLNKLMGFRGGY